MTGKTHKVGGICTGVIASTMILNTPYTIDKMILTTTMISGSILGSLMPDIDHKGSTIGSRVKLLSTFLSNVFGHRGMTHSPIVHMLITILLLTIGTSLEGYTKLLYISFVLGLFIGGLSHLLLDSLTVSGIPLFYPFTKKKYRLAKLTTGKNEVIVTTTLIVITCLIIKVRGY